MKKVGYLLFIVGLLSLSSCTGGNSGDLGPDFTDTEEIKKFISGKWHSDIYLVDHTRYYRYEISEDKIKFWISNDESNWNIEPDGEVGYFLGEQQTNWQKEEFRPLVMDSTILALNLKGTSLIYDYNSFDDSYRLRYDNALKRGW